MGWYAAAYCRTTGRTTLCVDSVNALAEEVYARTDHPSDLLPLFEHIDKLRQRIEGSGEVGIPESHHFIARVEKNPHADSDGFGLSLILRLPNCVEPSRRSNRDLQQPAPAIVGASIVDEQQVGRAVLPLGEARHHFDVRAFRLVEAWYHDAVAECRWLHGCTTIIA